MKIVHTFVIVFCIFVAVVILQAVIVGDLLTDHLETMTSDAPQSVIDQQIIWMTLVIGVIVILVFTAGLLVFLLLYVIRPLQRITLSIDALSQGNFTTKIERSPVQEIDSLGRSLERVVKTMKLAVLETRTAKKQIKLAEKKKLTRVYYDEKA